MGDWRQTDDGLLASQSHPKPSFSKTCLKKLSVDFNALYLHVDEHTCIHMCTNCVCNGIMSYYWGPSGKIAIYVGRFITSVQSLSGSLIVALPKDRAKLSLAIFPHSVVSERVEIGQIFRRRGIVE